MKQRPTSNNAMSNAFTITMELQKITRFMRCCCLHAAAPKCCTPVQLLQVALCSCGLFAHVWRNAT